MKFYFLHKKIIKKPKNMDFEYIICIKSSPFIDNIRLDNINYCPHEINEKGFTWNDPIDDDIDLITHENGIINKFKKIMNENWELWKKI